MDSQNTLTCTKSDELKTNLSQVKPDEYDEGLEVWQHKNEMKNRKKIIEEEWDDIREEEEKIMEREEKSRERVKELMIKGVEALGGVHEE